jgi:hypothetical protein
MKPGDEMSVIPYVDARYKVFAKAMTLLRCLRLTTGERRRPESDRPSMGVEAPRDVTRSRQSNNLNKANFWTKRHFEPHRWGFSVPPVLL